MKLRDLKAYLETQVEWRWEPDPEGGAAIIVINERLETANRVAFEAVKANRLQTIIHACKEGKDVDHVTRVTGYFSRTGSWNKGKVAELRDRYRSTI